MSILPLVDRIMVVQEGRITLFGPRDEVLEQIAARPPRPAPAVQGSRA
jgi:ATP-binding cassette subfamily C protein